MSLQKALAGLNETGRVFGRVIINLTADASVTKNVLLLLHVWSSNILCVALGGSTERIKNPK